MEVTQLARVITVCSNLERQFYRFPAVNYPFFSISSVFKRASVFADGLEIERKIIIFFRSIRDKLANIFLAFLVNFGQKKSKNAEARPLLKNLSQKQKYEFMQFSVLFFRSGDEGLKIKLNRQIVIRCITKLFV